MNTGLRPETTDAILTCFALIEAYERGDDEAVQALTARDLTESRRHLRAALMLLASVSELTGWNLNAVRQSLICSDTRKDDTK